MLLANRICVLICYSLKPEGAAALWFVKFLVNMHFMGFYDGSAALLCCFYGIVRICFIGAGL